MRLKTWFLIISVISLGVLPSTVQAAAISLEEVTRLAGESQEDGTGYRVARAGDVDKDGYEDVLIGIPSYTTEGNGAVYLVYGRPKRYGNLELTTEKPTMIKIVGEAANDHLGQAMAGVGDINGDGFDDIVLGSRYYDVEDDHEAGAVYILYGQVERFTSQTVGNFTKYIGVEPDDKVGYNVAGAGDINGDGLQDIIVGAPEDGDTKSGKVYLIYGQTDPLPGGSILNSVRLYGEEENDYAGSSVAGVGDINGDGFDDFTVGAYRNNAADKQDAGKVYIIYGQSEIFTNQFLNTFPSFQGEEKEHYLGNVLSRAGDLNNDTYDDFLIGAPSHDGNGTNAGAIYIVYGKADKFVGEMNVSETTRIFGQRKNDLAGFALASLDDINGDGYDDVLVGSPSQHAVRPGYAYIVYGRAEAYTETTLKSFEQYKGEVRQDRAGYAVAGVDMNGDGIREMVIGAVNYDNQAEADSGAVYIGYLPIRNCENSAMLGGIMADYPSSEYKYRRYAKNPKLRIVIEREGRQAHLVNCKTDKLLQTIEFNESTQQKILARVFTSYNTPLFVAVTRTKNKRNVKIFLYRQENRELVLTDYIKRRWRPRGLRLNVKRHRYILLAKGAERDKHFVKYEVLPDFKLYLFTNN